jgi:hypothetical protein
VSMSTEYLVLVQATNEMNVSIPEVADLLIERAQNSSWVVSLKALITMHHLMCYGNEVHHSSFVNDNARCRMLSSVFKRTWHHTIIIYSQRFGSIKLVCRVAVI